MMGPMQGRRKVLSKDIWEEWVGAEGLFQLAEAAAEKGFRA